MKMMEWLKEEITKTPGYMRVNLSLLTILMISSVSSTVLQILTVGENILEESTSSNIELQKERNEKLNQNLIGRSIMEVAQNSKKI